MPNKLDKVIFLCYIKRTFARYNLKQTEPKMIQKFSLFVCIFTLAACGIQVADVDAQRPGQIVFVDMVGEEPAERAEPIAVDESPLDNVLITPPAPAEETELDAVLACAGSCTGRTRSSSDVVAKLTFNAAISEPPISIMVSGNLAKTAPAATFAIRAGNGTVLGTGTYVGDACHGTIDIIVDVDVEQGEVFDLVTDTILLLAADTTDIEELSISLVGTTSSIELGY